MGCVTGMQRWTWTAALFAGALILLVVAIITHNAVPLFFMWVPFLAVPFVLSRPEPELRPLQPAQSGEANTEDAG